MTRVGTPWKVVDERLVDLQNVHGQVPQVAERRVPDAEVVDRDAHADATHPSIRVEHATSSSSPAGCPSGSLAANTNAPWMSAQSPGFACASRRCTRGRDDDADSSAPRGEADRDDEGSQSWYSAMAAMTTKKSKCISIRPPETCTRTAEHATSPRELRRRIGRFAAILI